MPTPALTALAREARRRQRLPHDATCSICPETRHLSRTEDSRILCYACRRLETGGSATELDHVAGKANLGGLVIRLRANDHRTVTDLRIQLGIEEWPPAEGDPLLILAHVLAGIASLLLLFAEWLVALAGDAKARIGAGIWEGAPVAPVVL